MTTSPAALIATFHEMEAEARADFTKKTGVHGSLLPIEDLTECARRDRQQLSQDRRMKDTR